jgi:hypothetical protein
MAQAIAKKVGHGSSFTAGKTGEHQLGRAQEGEREYSPNGRHPRDVWTIPTVGSHIKHYAMMPQELARRCVVAGTPPRVCAECGVPWEREVEVGEPVDHPLRENRNVAAVQFSADANAYGPGGNLGKTRERTPGPWHPACKCDAGFVAGLVLDPFCGAGTTGIVARRLGLRFLGFELDAEMCDVARARIAKAHVKEKRPPKQPDPGAQAPLALA